MTSASFMRVIVVVCLLMFMADDDAGSQVFVEDPDFIRGADVSFLQQIEDNGGIFRDRGIPGDAFRILRNHGLNYIRLRIWHTDPGAYSGIAKTLALATRARESGFKLLLDIHYSHTWADPGHQEIPPQWVGLPFEILRESVYTYSRDIVAALTANGTRPAMVQVGNEISCGMLWNEGNVCGSYNTSGQWNKLALLLAEAIHGVHDGAGPGESVGIMIHSDRGGDSAGAIWFFDHLTAANVPFDVIGLSYYPWWHGPLERVADNLDALSRRFGRDIIIVETAYPWTLQWADATGNIVGLPDQLLPGYPQNSLGQKKFLTDLMQLVAATPGGRGKGLLYWAPDWISTPTFGSAWENLALFNFHGDLHAGISAFEKNVTVTYSHGWNLVSAPVTLIDPGIAAVFPAAVSPGFEFDHGYVLRDSLDAGKGYWVKMENPAPLLLSGLPIVAETLHVREGWNLIGSISNALPAAEIIVIPPGIVSSQVYGYDGGYHVADTLYPGKGYWLKSSQEGMVIVGPGFSPNKPAYGGHESGAGRSWMEIQK